MMPGVIRNPRMVIEVFRFGQPKLLFLQSQKRYYYLYSENGLCRISRKAFFDIVEEYKND